MVNGEGPFRADVKMLEQAAELGIIKDLFDRDGKKLDFCCFGLINAYLRSPILEAA